MRFNLWYLSTIPKWFFGGNIEILKDVPEDHTLRANEMTKTMYFADPEHVAIKVCSIVIMHDKIKKQEVTL